jgi:CheY-like chemotaxis protein
MTDNAVVPRVMIVDDDDDVRDILTLLLRDEGFTVTAASNGAEAMRAIDGGEHPDVILLDLMMPVMNGWELWEHLRRSPNTAHIPVVVLTASGLEQGCLGNAVVLPKPTGVEELMVAISSACAA